MKSPSRDSSKSPSRDRSLSGKKSNEHSLSTWEDPIVAPKTKEIKQKSKSASSNEKIEAKKYPSKNTESSIDITKRKIKRSFNSKDIANLFDDGDSDDDFITGSNSATKKRETKESLKVLPRRSRKNSTITLTFGDCAENHVGMQMIGEIAEVGFSLDDLKNARDKFVASGCTNCELVDLN